MPMLELLASSKELYRFKEGCSLIAPFCEKNYSYVGANFNSSDIFSIKIYQTFFNYDALVTAFPFSEIKESILRYKGQISKPHVSTPFVPGCGFTYTLKLNDLGCFSRGVYFRVKHDAKKYVEEFLSRTDMPLSFSSFFDCSGVLKYIEIDDRGVVDERNYFYCMEPEIFEKIDAESGVYFSKADCLEISSGDDRQERGRSIIGLSRKNLANQIVGSRVKELENIFLNNDLISTSNFSLNGYYLDKEVHSVFFFDDKGVRIPRFNQGISKRKVLA